MTGVQLDGAIRRSGISKADIARLLGVTYQTIWLYVTEKQKISQDMENKIERILLMLETNDLPKTAYAPMLLIEKNIPPQVEQVAVHRIGIRKEILSEPDLTSYDEIVKNAERIQAYREDIEARRPLPLVYVLKIGSDLKYLLVRGRLS